MTCGIYALRDEVGHTVYVGASLHIERRWKEHAWYRRGKGQRGNVTGVVLEETLPDGPTMDAAERRWLAHYRNQGWTVLNGAFSVPYTVWSMYA